MREIKYRAYRPSNLMTPEAEMLSWEELGKLVSVEYLMRAGEESGYRLMQFTGLQDKNGADIYEGDILLEQGDKFDWCRPVVWHNASWVFSIGRIFADAPERFNPLHYANTRMVVVGNIYENPELLSVAP